MDEALVRRLVALNEAFYARFAASFAASRAAAQPGFTHLLPCLLYTSFIHRALGRASTG